MLPSLVMLAISAVSYQQERSPADLYKSILFLIISLVCGAIVVARKYQTQAGDSVAAESLPVAKSVPVAKTPVLAMPAETSSTTEASPAWAEPIVSPPVSSSESIDNTADCTVETLIPPPQNSLLRQTMTGLRKLSAQLQPKPVVVTAEQARTAVSWLEKAAALEEKQSWEDAIHCLNSALQADPRNWKAMSHKALCLFRLDRIEQSLRWYDRALSVEMRSPDIWLGKASCLLSCRKYRDALECFNRALELDSSCETAQMGRNRCQSMLARP